MALLTLSACQEKVTQPIIDETTLMEPIRVEVEGDMYRVTHLSDSMDRGKHDYLSSEHGDIVIDPSYYSENEFMRGDIIYFKQPEQTYMNIARVIAISGETVEIKEGQVYVNNRKLDAFYGRAHRLGADLNELRGLIENNNHKDHIRQNINNMIEYFENMDYVEVTIPKDHVYIIGDDWFRSSDSRNFGPLETGDIAGKVMGYEKMDD